MRTFARAALTLALTLPLGGLMAGCGGEGQNTVTKDAVQTMPPDQKQKYMDQMKNRMGGPSGMPGGPGGMPGGPGGTPGGGGGMPGSPGGPPR
jgi:hypothetical protein